MDTTAGGRTRMMMTMYETAPYENKPNSVPPQASIALVRSSAAYVTPSQGLA